MSGFLVKEGHKVTNLKRRYFVLKSDSSTIYYFKSDKVIDKEPLGTIELKDAELDDQLFFK
jgi:hypothetical protein